MFSSELGSQKIYYLKLGENKMKYVRHKSKGLFLFPDTDVTWHSDLGAFLGVDGILSAGFVRFNKDGTPECNGRSESLRIGSLEDDSLLLLEQMAK